MKLQLKPRPPAGTSCHSTFPVRCQDLFVSFLLHDAFFFCCFFYFVIMKIHTVFTFLTSCVGGEGLALGCQSPAPPVVSSVLTTSMFYILAFL